MRGLWYMCDFFFHRDFRLEPYSDSSFETPFMLIILFRRVEWKRRCTTKYPKIIEWFFDYIQVRCSHKKTKTMLFCGVLVFFSPKNQLTSQSTRWIFFYLGIINAPRHGLYIFLVISVSIKYVTFQ